ncbi:MAG: hypothetical protein K8L91_01285 [Anaerolineae bacterium]|nr:hypothetical protein [Anaerolineae bacterium]
MPPSKQRLLILAGIFSILMIAVTTFLLWPDPIPPATIEAPSGEMERHPRTPTAAPPLDGIPEPAVGAMMLPAKDTIPYPASVEGEVLFVRDGDLYAARFDDKVATPLDTEVIPTSLHLSPDQRTLLYQKHDDRRDFWLLFALNTATHEIVKLDEHPNAFLDFEFSPDGAWVAYIQTAYPDMLAEMRDMYKRREQEWQHIDQQLVIKRVDGKGSLVWIDGVYMKTWLADNTLLAVYHRSGPFYSNITPMRVVPEDGTPDPDAVDNLVIDLISQPVQLERSVALVRARAELIPILSYSNLRPAAPTNDTEPGTVAISPTGEAYIEIVRETEAGHCGRVTLMRRGYSVPEVPQEIYQLRNPLDVRNPVWMTNDGVLFTVMDAPHCDATLATASLYFVAPYAEAHPIANGLDLTTGAPFAPSGDGRYVLWAGVDAVTGQGFIALTNNLTGESSRVMVGTPGQHFGGLVWVNHRR